MSRRSDAALLIDFGSTYTKLRAVDLAAGAVVAAGQGPSTVTTDVTIGLEAALADLDRHMGGLPEFRYRLASSSAAGGLRMVTVGLVTELTAEAARRAALGAGARLVGSFSYRLTDGDVAAVVDLSPDVLLLSGGTDGGNSEVILHNARRLAESSLACPVIAAGNRNAADQISAVFSRAGKPLITAGNVMPAFQELDIEPAREAIRRVFIDRIVHAKGIDRAAKMFDAVLMPTPAAVMTGAQLLAEGVAGRPGLGPLVVLDIGGATTDVHSIASGDPTGQGVVQHGLPEPFAKRTVEGDLGMRHNARTIVDTEGVDRIAAAAGVSSGAVERWLSRIEDDVKILPRRAGDRAIDHAMACAALRIAMRRHAGTIRIAHTAAGPVAVQEGKDLTAVKAVIGTGGALVHAAAPAEVMAAALGDPSDATSLRPIAPVLYIDERYMLYAAGLLAEVEPAAALAVAMNGIRSTGGAHERSGTG
ncbi:MAG: glutamate mutase L [Rhodospirillales bacterium]|nr:MAG: glutamate mutase L [Rhodospirillales bacterium]